MNITEAQTTDKSVLSLFAEHDDFMLDFLGEDSCYYTRYNINERIDKVWIAYCGGIPVGCIAYREQDKGIGEVKRLFITKKYRGRGMSVKLLETVEQYAAEQGCSTLCLDTRITLEPAVSLYRSFGFVIVFRQDLYIKMEKIIQR